MESLLRFAKAFDDRYITDETVDAWLEIAREERWSYRDVREAIKNHYRSTRDRMYPVDVISEVKEMRRVVFPPRFVDGDPLHEPASPEFRKKIMAEFRARHRPAHPQQEQEAV
ncbi:hypothetical protein HMPREF9336_02805 [Segniliparus rugosus ATCC BAA-974]|uniref:Replicative helicase inhibitor G39P N-terminal domain-containing protein n=2 Tax=Segniliparus rugosus TaxID=286804 RepID=E5XTI3_SEGRC|nr:hypothetical protein HMPREF9336_02805 [Segniliparus rugosus ATCC BAA-974]